MKRKKNKKYFSFYGKRKGHCGVSPRVIATVIGDTVYKNATY
nr:MAG TPA: hypothetical protein [Caudoviricetes sp.]